MKEIRIFGIIIPNMPAEEADEWLYLSKSYDIDIIFLVASTSSDQRIKFIGDRGPMLLYTVLVLQEQQ